MRKDGPLTIFDLPDLAIECGDLLYAKDESGFERFMFQCGLRCRNTDIIEQMARDVLETMPQEVKDYWGGICTLCGQRRPHAHN